MPPLQVADAVFDAIKKEQLYISLCNAAAHVHASLILPAIICVGIAVASEKPSNKLGLAIQPTIFEVILAPFVS